MTRTLTATVPVALVLLGAWIGTAGAASQAGGSHPASGALQPIVTVIRHGGLPAPGGQSADRHFRISDTTISGDGYRPRPLTPSERLALRRAMAALNRPYLRAHPFRGTCPTASDGIESIYRFRGFAPTLASCTYDLRRVQAVQLTELLLAKLRPR
jgi:hypothetical protein